MSFSASVGQLVRRIVAPHPLRICSGMFLAGLVGGAVAVPGVQWAIYFGGGGHGTVSPLFVLFGPVMMIWYQTAFSDPSSQTGDVWLIAGMFSLYAGYAAAFAWGRRRSMGKWVAIAVFFLHYTLVAILAVVEPYMSSFQEFTNLLGSVPFYHSFGLIEYFFLLHVAAVAFSVSSWPVSRKDVKRTAQCVALVSLVSLAYVVWAVATSTRGV
jgi:hypothetical protein